VMSMNMTWGQIFVNYRRLVWGKIHCHLSASWSEGIWDFQQKHFTSVIIWRLGSIVLDFWYSRDYWDLCQCGRLEGLWHQQWHKQNAWMQSACALWMKKGVAKGVTGSVCCIAAVLEKWKWGWASCDQHWWHSTSGSKCQLWWVRCVCSWHRWFDWGRHLSVN
jgi:hypothetical protein